MAAPERIDLVPISEGEYPNVDFPPPRMQVDRMNARREALVAFVLCSCRNIVLMVVSRDADGTRR